MPENIRRSGARSGGLVHRNSLLFSFATWRFDYLKCKSRSFEHTVSKYTIRKQENRKNHDPIRDSKSMSLKLQILKSKTDSHVYYISSKSNFSFVNR